jgi:sterol 3beta-glucosyltransferase
MFEQAVDACKNNDVLISGHLQPIARMMHELVAIPFVSLHTNHFGGLQPKPFRDASCAVINPFRRLHGLEQLSDPLHTEAHSPQLALHVISRHLRTPTSRFPTHHHVTGFFFLDETGWTPDESLRDFLESGPPPLAISFSSMVHRDPSAMTNLLLQATEELGCRAIIQSGWSGLAESTSLPPHVFATGYVPHTWLFSSASCIIHAGGAGTTAAALWSGVPAVIVPHLIDQPLWAELVQGLGCARSIIHLRDLTVDALSQGIRATLDDPDLLSNSKSFGKKIRAEQGVDRACDLIEKTMREIGIIE